MKFAPAVASETLAQMAVESVGRQICRTPIFLLNSAMLMVDWKRFGRSKVLVTFLWKNFEYMTRIGMGAWDGDALEQKGLQSINRQGGFPSL